jgi:hypothetical protein
MLLYTGNWGACPKSFEKTSASWLKSIFYLTGICASESPIARILRATFLPF